MKNLMILLVASVLLAGCDESALGPGQRTAICNALIGPIRYNTFNKASQRYAAILLAMDLKQRNQVGQRLGCSQYR